MTTTRTLPAPKRIANLGGMLAFYQRFSMHFHYPPKIVKAGPDTVFVLGNGPSLKQVDLLDLSGHRTIGVNAAYRYWREIDWRPTYYACLDEVVGMSHIEAIEELICEGRIEKFLLRDNLIRALGTIGTAHQVSSYEALAKRDLLFSDPLITTGSGAALWGAHLGFRTIIIAGVDAAYSEVVEGAAIRDGIELEIVRSGRNPNYFFDSYQQPGDRYNRPNPAPDLHINAWHSAACKIYAHTQTNVFNANHGSAVRHFPYVTFPEVLSEGSAVTPPLDPIMDPREMNSDPLSETSISLRRRVLNKESKRITLIIVAFVFLILLSLWAFELERSTAAAFSLLMVLVAFLTLGLVYTRRAVAIHLGDLQNGLVNLTQGMSRTRPSRVSRHLGVDLASDFVSPLSANGAGAVEIDLTGFFGGDGWHFAEPHGRWAGKAAVSRICLGNLEPGTYEFEIVVVSAELEDWTNQIEIRVNGSALPFRHRSDEHSTRSIRRLIRPQAISDSAVFPSVIFGQFDVTKRGSENREVLLEITQKPGQVDAEARGLDDRNLTICVSKVTLSRRT
ncbi:MAG: hypothetical protein NXH72_04225 [Hyphomonadaceae bacterium]|nr:hypothetical protein [Hyphomonadaceae bacterium]